MRQDEKDKFIGCPSYLRGRREKAKTRGGLRLSILPQASYQVATDTIHIPNHTAHPMGTGRLSVCRSIGTDIDLCFFPASGNRKGTGLNNRFNGFSVRAVQHSSIEPSIMTKITTAA